MTASPARSLLERAAEVYQFETNWQRPDVASRDATVHRLETGTPVPRDGFDAGPEIDTAADGFDAGPQLDEPATADELGTAPAWIGRSEDAAAEPVGELSQPQQYDRVGRAPMEEPGLRGTSYVLPGAPPTVLAEEFRLAKRAPLAHAFGGPGQEPSPRGRLILVCSASAGEGKSFCALNLALSLAAEQDTRVVLIDGDVAKPSLMATFGINSEPHGLLDAVADRSLDPDALLVPSGVPNLLLMAAGQRANNATELLASSDARRLFDGLLAADERRIVVVDSPPLLAASPAVSLTMHVGQAVLVVRADRTTESELRDAHALLDRIPAVHLLLNGVSFARGRTRLGSYYGVAP